MRGGAGERHAMPPVTAATDRDARADHAGPAPLREFCENPEVPASSRPDLARRMARMLALSLRGVSAPARILSVGSGHGMAAGTAAPQSPRPRMTPPRQPA